MSKAAVSYLKVKLLNHLDPIHDGHELNVLVDNLCELISQKPRVKVITRNGVEIFIHRNRGVSR